MAQNDFEERIRQAESGGRRYDKSGKLLTSPKGAEGEMQVMPKTQRDPGFGVTPAKGKNPDEIARVGKDYLAAMEKRYGDKTLAAIAYNMGPGATDKWIAAGSDFSKLPAETQGYVQKVMGAAPASRTTKQAATEPASSTQMMEKALKSGMTADLGSGYKAALALAFLGSEDQDLPTTDEELQDRLNTDMEERMAALTPQKPRFNAVSGLDLQALNAAPAQEPVQMSHGGAVHRADGSPEEGEVKTPMLFSVPTYAETVSHEMYPGQGGQYDQKDAARHMLAAGTLQRKYGETAAEMLGKLHEIKTSPLRWLGSKVGISEMPVDYEQDLHNNRMGIELAKRSKSQKDLEDLVMQEAQRARKERSPGAAWIGKPVKRADGSPETGEVGPYIGNPNIRRQGAAARALAAQRDVNTLPDPRTYAAVSGFLGTPVEQQGFSVLHPDLQGIKRAGDVGFMAGTAAQIAPAVGAMRNLGKGVTESAKALQGLKDIPVGLSVKPVGGTFATSGSLSQEPISKLDNLLAKYAEEMQKKMPDVDPAVITDFVDKKARKYLTTSYGTGRDQIRLALNQSQLPLHGKDAEAFPEYLLAAARNPDAPGHAQAKRHLEKFYDERVNMEGRVFTKGQKAETADYTRMRAEEERIRQRMTQEGLPQDFQNPVTITNVSPEDISKYPTSYGVYGQMLEAQKAGKLLPNQAYAIQHGEAVYDVKDPMLVALRPESVAENIAMLPPNKLKNMSFEQAVIEGAQAMQPRRDYSVAVDRASKGLSVPKEVVSMYTTPVTKTDTGSWVRITDPMATEMEGKLMHHSVGGYNTEGTYGHGGIEAFKNGTAQVFSLRDAKTALPQVTIEAKKGDKALEISQIKGEYNSFPSHRAEDVFKFLDEQPNIDKIKSEYYLRDNKGKELDKPIRVDWASSFENWKQNLPGEWSVVRDDPSGVEYVWKIPDAKATGGMVERKNSDNRRYL